MPFVVRTPVNSFTVAYRPQAHAKNKKDMNETPVEVFGKP